MSLHWRFLGNIDLIAAPDLATSLLEPRELLAFVGGRLDVLFRPAVKPDRVLAPEADIPHENVLVFTPDVN